MGQPVVYLEVGAKDHAALISFHRELFGWTNTDMGEAYARIDTGAGGGMT